MRKILVYRLLDNVLCLNNNSSSSSSSSSNSNNSNSNSNNNSSSSSSLLNPSLLSPNRRIL